MKQSTISGNIGNDEFAILVDQNHFEKVWNMMLPTVNDHAEYFIREIVNRGDSGNGELAYSSFVKQLISKNENLSEKYKKIFDIELFEDEYSDDIDGFKGTILKKECDIINKTLQSRAEALNVWKRKFYASKSQEVFDTCFNFISFGYDYNEALPESDVAQIHTIEETGLDQMNEDACYLSGVFGYGIVSNILNHMYPRVFPGNYKKGVFSLLFFTGKGLRGIDMPSETSEFCMVKDEEKSKTGTIEVEHNYYFPYETFALYAYRIFAVLESKIDEMLHKEYPAEYRFLLTNAFFDYYTAVNQDKITTLTGNDDVFKFTTPW